MGKINENQRNFEKINEKQRIFERVGMPRALKGPQARNFDVDSGALREHPLAEERLSEIAAFFTVFPLQFHFFAREARADPVWHEFAKILR